MTARYVGELWGVRVGSRFVPVRRVALGLVAGVGLVTAETPADLAAGRLFRAAPSGAYQPASEVYYTRDRRAMGYPGGSNWKHKLKSSLFAVGPDGPVFLAASKFDVARVCPTLPGDFIFAG